MTNVARQHPTPQTAADDRQRRLNTLRDIVAAALIVIGALLPWNIATGLTIADTSGWALGLLIVVTLLSLASVVLTHAGPMSIGRPDADRSTLDKVRLVLNLPLVALAAGFAIFAVVQAVRAGGTTMDAPGVGPGAWLGVAGALLAAAPVITGADELDQRVSRVRRVIAVVSLALAAAAVLFNLYWRTRFVLPDVGDADTGMQNLVVVVAAVLYGIVALVPVIVVGGWIFSGDEAAALATVLTAIAVLVAGAALWWLPVGRDLDAFHGIAQTTSTAGVGFEGFLAWVAVGALIGTATARAAFGADSAALWRAAARKSLLLVGSWCVGSAVLRIVDLFLSSVLALPEPPYNSTATMAFDLVVAVVAFWLLVNTRDRGAPKLLLTVLYGVLFVLTVCRVVVGVALVPRVQPLDPADITDVYGNTLAQQITGTFDVALCLLTLMLFLGTIRTRDRAAGHPIRRRATATPRSAFDKVLSSPAAQSDPWAPAAQQTPTTGTPATVVLPAGGSGATTAIPTAQFGTARIASVAPPTTAPPAQAATAKIARPDTVPKSHVPDRVEAVLAESSRRFAAGTTYGGSTSSGDTDNPGR